MDGFEVLDPVRSEDFGKCDLPPPTAFLDFTTAKTARREGLRASSGDRSRRRLRAAGRTASFGTIGKIESPRAQMVAAKVGPALFVRCLLRHLPKFHLPKLRRANDHGKLIQGE
jgi:hypothetical protein